MESGLAPYQQEVVDKYLSNVKAGIKRNAIVMPAGSGKIAILAELLKITKPARVLVITPHFPVFQQRIWTLPEALQGEIVDRCDIVEHENLDQGISLNEYSWDPVIRDGKWRRKYDLVVVDGFARSSTSAWKYALTSLLGKDKEIPVLGLSTMSLRFTYDEWDVGKSVFHDNYVVRMGLVEAWEREDIPVSKPQFVTSKDPWVRDLLQLRVEINRATRSRVYEIDRDSLRRRIAGTLEGHVGRADFIDHLPRRDGKYLVFCRYVDEVPILEEWLRHCLAGEVDDVHFYSVHYMSTDPSGEIKRFTYDDSAAIKFLIAINMVGDDDSISCDGVLIARPTTSINVYLRLIAQSSQAGEGALVMDLEDTISKASEWSIDISEDTEENRELRRLHSVIAASFGVKARYGSNVSGAHKGGYRSDPSPLRGSSSSRGAYTSTSVPWTREEDDALIDNAPDKDVTFISWSAKIPNRSLSEIEARANELGVRIRAPKEKWTDQENSRLAVFYPDKGPNWKGWSEELPRRSRRDIVIRARALGLYIRGLPWREEEIEFIKTQYPLHVPSWDGWRKGVPDHSPVSIRIKAKEMGLAYKEIQEGNEPQREVRKDDDSLDVVRRLLQPNQPLSGRASGKPGTDGSYSQSGAVSKHTVTRGSSAQERASGQGGDRQRKGRLHSRSWEEGEDDLIRRYYPQYGADITRWKEKPFGRKKAAIEERAKTLGVTRRSENEGKSYKAENRQSMVTVDLQTTPTQPCGHDWAPSEDAALRECYSRHPRDWQGWTSVLPGIAWEEIERQATMLDIASYAQLVALQNKMNKH